MRGHFNYYFLSNAPQMQKCDQVYCLQNYSGGNVISDFCEHCVIKNLNQSCEYSIVFIGCPQ